MKIPFAIISLAIIAISCHSPRKNQDVKLVNVKIDSSRYKEYIAWDSIKLNGQIPMVSNFNDAVKLLEKPDSIITPNYDNVSESFESKKFKYCYIKGITFEKYNDSLVFRSIDLSKSGNWYLSYGKIKFDSETTMDEFAKSFPKSVDENILHGTDMDKYLSISVKTARRGSSINEQWVFMFEQSHNKLIQIDYWIDD